MTTIPPRTHAVPVAVDPLADEHIAASPEPSTTRTRVVIVGGGVAGLEALLALRHLAADLVDVTVIAPEDDFVYRPLAVGEPFALGHAIRHSLRDFTREVSARLLKDGVVEVDADGRAVVTSGGRRVPFDALLVTVGARAGAGLEGAITWTPESDPDLLGGILRDGEEGYAKRIAFVIPAQPTWPLPAYELALMTARQVWGAGRDDSQITLITPEDAPLAVFGLQASEAVKDLLDKAGVGFEGGAYASTRPGLGDHATTLILDPGGRELDVDRVVSLPRLHGPDLRGVACDAEGFILTDRHGQVEGTERVWAAGDGVAFPIKHGGLAAQQADAAAQAIAAFAGASVEPQPFRPVLRGILMGADELQFMRHQVAGGDGDGATGITPLWWPPTKIAGRYLAPYLAAVDEAAAAGEVPEPDGLPVELDFDAALVGR
jgi:sulfide:quinone oxidoreductase